MNMHVSPRRARSLWRWFAGVGSTVAAALIVAAAIGVQHSISDQARSQIATAAHLKDLTTQVHQLRTELASVPDLRDRVSHLEAEHMGLARRVTVLESRQQ